MSLFTPDLLTEQVIDLVRRLHPEHLAALERDRGLDAETVERFRTVDVLAGEGMNLHDDQRPCALIGTFGTVDRPNVRARKLDIVWLLAAEITVTGVDRADSVKRRDWYTLTLVECVLCRLPRKDAPAHSIELADIDLIQGAVAKTQRSYAQARVTFDVVVKDALDLSAFTPDDTPLDPGSPGGPPEDPYTPPVPWPHVTSVTANADREPIE